MDVPFASRRPTCSLVASTGLRPSRLPSPRARSNPAFVRREIFCRSSAAQVKATAVWMLLISRNSGSSSIRGVITDRGKPTFALLKIEDYYKLAGEKPRSLLDIMDSLPGGEFEFNPPKLNSLGFKPVELG